VSKENFVLEQLNAGTAKNEIITALVRDHGLDLQGAAKLYTDTAQANGFIMSKDDKAKVVAEALTNHTADGTLNRDAAEADVMEKAHVTKLTASSLLKKAAEEANIAWPKATRQARDHDAIADVVKQWHDQGVEEERIKAGLREHYKFTEKNVDAAYRKYGKMAGFLQGGGGDRSAVIDYMVANRGKGRKEWIDGMMKATDCKLATAETRYTMSLYCEDFHKAVTEQS